ncbi:MAG: GntR family transcriptional regulator [Saprospiraceae bacterium]|nr:GntR family transcriptional regulator [Saprospiraceae bacterium]
MKKIISINEYSKTPKYRQIVNSILSGIEEGIIDLEEKLPSVNRLLIDFDISRDTIVKAYDYLQKIGIVESVRGKGYFVKSKNTQRKAKVFLLFNKLSLHKKIIYDSLSTTLGDEASIDFYIYNNDFRLFKNYINASLAGNFTHFVIIAHFLEGGKDASEVINQIPKSKLIVLDKKVEGITGEYAAVYQEFANNIYSALTEALDLVRKYNVLKIIFPVYGYHPREILTGFENFCLEYAFDYQVVDNLDDCMVDRGEAFVCLMEDDLVTLIKKVKSRNFVVGNDIGIISYNETPLKEILLNGITVISTDFEQLGKTVGELILWNRKEQVANPFRLILRQSL